MSFGMGNPMMGNRPMMGTGQSLAGGGVAGPSGKMPKAPKGYSWSQQFSPEQMNLFRQLFANVSPGSYLSRLAGGEQGMFDEMEAPALRQFNEIQGGIASRFSGMGMGARRSSGFQNTMNQASSNFAQDLQSKRQGLQQQAIIDLMGMGNDLLGQKPYALNEKPQSGWSKFAEAFGGALPGAIAGMAGSPAGAGQAGQNFAAPYQRSNAVNLGSAQGSVGQSYRR